MGRKSKLKQLRRKPLGAIQSNSWIEDLNVITVGIDDNNWLFRYGNPFDPDAKTVHQGSLNSCIDLAYKTIPTLYIESREQMRWHCGEFGMLEGGDWHIIYKAFVARNTEPWHQIDVDKFNAAMASVKLN
jgi:hypothetical protein